MVPSRPTTKNSLRLSSLGELDPEDDSHFHFINPGLNVTLLVLNYFTHFAVQISTTCSL